MSLRVPIESDDADNADANAVPEYEYTCHESVALICSRLGEIYEKLYSILNEPKLDEQANTLQLSVIQHAAIVTDTSGATFFSRDWYQSAQTSIQNRRARKEAEAAQKAKELEKKLAPLRQKIKPKIDAMLKIMNEAGKEVPKPGNSVLVLSCLVLTYSLETYDLDIFLAS